MDDAPSPFVSRSFAQHMVRGVIGYAAFVVAVGMFYAAQGWGQAALALAIGAVSVVALRGCPLCWLFGLAQMTLRALRGEPVGGSCAACSLPPRGGG